MPENQRFGANFLVPGNCCSFHNDLGWNYLVIIDRQFQSCIPDCRLWSEKPLVYNHESSVLVATFHPLEVRD